MRKIITRSKLLLASVFLVALLCCTSSVCAQQATFTITGRVTDQSTGQPISGVAIAGVGNQTGAKVAITDAQGNYTLPFGANTNIKLRAYKTNYIFNPVSAEISSFGGFSLFGTFTNNFAGSSFPFRILIFAQPPILLAEDESLNALALDSLQHTRD